MKPIQLHLFRRPRVTFPTWGWRLVVVAVAVVGCLPTVIVRLQLQATLDEFDANRGHAGRQVNTGLAAAASHRNRNDQGGRRERDAGVLR